MVHSSVGIGRGFTQMNVENLRSSACIRGNVFHES
jgi:hypothetical protein